MRSVWCAALCISMSLTSAPAVSTPPPEAGTSAESVGAILEKLGHEDFKVREEATRKLWAMGSKVEGQLREAAKGGNPEIIKRATFILRKIELDLSPDTPAEVLALVDRFSHAGRDDKFRIIFELQKQGAWRQILKLYALEKDENLKARIRPKVEEVAIRAAREEITKGRLQEALEFLKMGPSDAAGLMALAEFHRTQGTLKAELANAKGPEHAAWRLALLRASGDIEGARAAAIDAGEGRVAAVMDMLKGDPLPWLRSSPPGDGAPSLHALYVQLAEKHWKGEALTAKDFDPVQPFMRASGDDSNRWMGSGLYFLLGESAAGESSISKLNPMVAFRHFDLLERVPEALKVIGLDPDKPDYAAWIGKRAKAVIDHPDDSDEEQLELVTLATFLERRGLRDELKAYDPFLSKLAADDSEVFLSLLSSLFGNVENATGAVSLAKRAALNYAGDDDAKWGEVLDAVFGQSHEAQSWWTWLGELDAASGREARFDGLMALMRHGIDPGHLRKRWLKLAWDSIDSMPKDKAVDKLNLMKDLALQSNDLTSGLKAWDLLTEDIEDDDEEEDITDRSGVYLLYLSAAGRWQDAATLWMKLIEKTPGRAEFHAYAAACLRRLGKENEAVQQDQLAEKLALADPSTCVRIGQAYSYGGDFQRAGQWWERVVIECPPEAEIWVRALALHGQERTAAQDWKRAAAVNEVLACNGYESNSEVPSLRIRLRVNADFARALSRLKTDRENSIKLLEKCHALLAADGSLADYFFPAVRKAGLIEEHDAWFERSWKMLDSVIKQYPAGDNSRNTAAWLAARAVKRLDEAEEQVDKALASAPEQAAYLDTKAEIAFARKDRKRALELSKQSLISDPLDDSLRHQLERYRTAPFPVP